MTPKNTIIIIALVSVLIFVSGCLESGRKESAQMRWQRTMDHARLEAAQQSLEEGRLVYAERVLEGRQSCDLKASTENEILELEARIQTESEQFAKADKEIKSIEEMIY